MVINKYIYELTNNEFNRYLLIMYKGYKRIAINTSIKFTKEFIENLFGKRNYYNERIILGEDWYLLYTIGINYIEIKDWMSINTNSFKHAIELLNNIPEDILESMNKGLYIKANLCGETTDIMVSNLVKNNLLQYHIVEGENYREFHSDPSNPTKYIFYKTQFELTNEFKEKLNKRQSKKR